MPSWLRLPAALLCAGLAWLPVVIGAVAAAPLQAQAPPGPVPLGSTVRVSVQGQARPIEGTLLSASNGSWTISRPDAPPTILRADQVVGAHVQRQRRYPLAGGLVGGGVGVALALRIRSDAHCPENAIVCDVLIAPMADPIVNLSTLALPIVGAAAGALIGRLIRTTTWVPAVVAPGGLSPSTTLEFAWRVPIGGNPR
ncbi:MAG: hypothetical protein KJO06_06610 [Gemmatimonadetes bacterium]|nr:hypothetical protein [Gemmatimonadota bacterium]